MTGDQFDTSNTHPARASRWIEGMRAKEARGLTRAHVAASRAAATSAALAPDRSEALAAAPASTSGRARFSDARPAFASASRARIELRPLDLGPGPANGIVALPGGGLWEIPPSFRGYTPAELLVFVAKGGTVPDSIASAFNASIDALAKRQEWKQLPGDVAPPAADPAR